MTESQIWTIIIFTGTVLLGFMSFMGVGMGLLIRGWHDLSLEVRGTARDVKDLSKNTDDRFDRIEAKLQEHDGRFAELRATGEQMADQIYGLGKKLDDHLRWHAS